jgi:hypothetical protein
MKFVMENIDKEKNTCELVIHSVGDERVIFSHQDLGDLEFNGFKVVGVTSLPDRFRDMKNAPIAFTHCSIPASFHAKSKGGKDVT